MPERVIELPDAESLKILYEPLSQGFAVLMIIIGIYSLTINVKDARRFNHKRAEKAATIGGWFYVISGGGLLLIRLLT